jgi:hypothetical protein
MSVRCHRDRRDRISGWIGIGGSRPSSKPKPVEGLAGTDVWKRHSRTSIPDLAEWRVSARREYKADCSDAIP